jgi:large subunit ribosomal protein L21
MMPMYAVVEIAGRQFKVTPKDRITVPTLKEKAGDAVQFDRVLLLDNGTHVSVGSPLVSGALVRGTVLEHDRMDKVTIFKKKRRKGYRVTRGHRQGVTRIEITNIEG